MVLSLVHSVLYTGLMLCAFLLGKPQPATFTFGLSHGIMYMVMTAAAAVAMRLRTLSVTTGLIVIVLGAACPYFGSFDLVREERRAPVTPP